MTEQTEIGPEVPTGIVNPPELANADTGLAWSEDYPPTGEVPVLHRASWRKVILAVAAALATAATIVFAVVVLAQPPRVIEPVPTPSAAPSPPPPPPTLDDRYIQFVNMSYPAGWQVGDRAQTLSIGHWACEYLGEDQGRSVDDTITYLDTEPSSLDRAVLHQINEARVDAAVTIYCPEFRSTQARDDAFISALKGVNIIIRPGHEQEIIWAAHFVCQKLGEGVDRSEIERHVYDAHAPGETEQFAKDNVAMMIKYYCPQFG